MDLEKTLSYNYVFKGLSHEQLVILASQALIREYLGGDQLVRQFDQSTDLMILLEGNAISRTFSGEVVAKFGPGSVIGEVALIDGQARSANVVSVGTSKVAVLPSTAVYALMEADPSAGYTIMKNLAGVLCRRLRSMNENADTMSFAKAL